MSQNCGSCGKFTSNYAEHCEYCDKPICDDCLEPLVCLGCSEKYIMKRITIHERMLIAEHKEIVKKLKDKIKKLEHSIASCSK